MTRKVALFLPQELQLSSIAAPTDLLQMANRFAHERTGQSEGTATRDDRAHIACRWLSLDGKPVRLSSGGLLPVDAALHPYETCDVVFIGAFEVADDGAALQQKLDANRPLLEWLQRQHREGALIAASGSGVFLLAETGLLDRRAAAVPWWQQRLFHRRYPAVRLAIDQPLTEQDGLLCAGSLASLMPMSLRITCRLTSPNTAEWLTKTTLIDASIHPESSAMMLNPADATADPLVATAQYHLRQHYADPTQIAALAHRLSVSPRTLGRRFQAALGLSPQAYVQTLRIDAAKRMLLRTRLRVDRIGEQVGYSDAGFFKRLFRTHTGVTPAAWRTHAGASHTALEKEDQHARPS